MVIINVHVQVHTCRDRQSPDMQACSYEPHRESYTTLWALLEGHIELDGPIVLNYGYSGHACMEIHTWK